MAHFLACELTGERGEEVGGTNHVMTGWEGVRLGVIVRSNGSCIAILLS